MTRYVFAITKGNHAPEVVGSELPDAEAARAEAAKLMGQDLKDRPAAFWSDEEWEIAVSDESGLVLFTLTSVGYRSAALR